MEETLPPNWGHCFTSSAQAFATFYAISSSPVHAPLSPGSLRQLTDGTELVEVADLQRAGPPVKGLAKDGAYTVGKGWRMLIILPASHGCVRMPLTGRNPAKFFYEWVQSGTPVTIMK